MEFDGHLCMGCERLLPTVTETTASIPPSSQPTIPLRRPLTQHPATRSGFRQSLARHSSLVRHRHSSPWPHGTFRCPEIADEQQSAPDYGLEHESEKLYSELYGPTSSNSDASAKSTVATTTRDTTLVDKPTAASESKVPSQATGCATDTERKVPRIRLQLKGTAPTARKTNRYAPYGIPAERGTDYGPCLPPNLKEQVYVPDRGPARNPHHERQMALQQSMPPFALPHCDFPWCKAV